MSEKARSLKTLACTVPQQCMMSDICGDERKVWRGSGVMQVQNLKLPLVLTDGVQEGKESVAATTRARINVCEFE